MTASDWLKSQKVILLTEVSFRSFCKKILVGGRRPATSSRDCRASRPACPWRAGGLRLCLFMSCLSVGARGRVVAVFSEKASILQQKRALPAFRKGKNSGRRPAMWEHEGKGSREPPDGRRRHAAPVFFFPYLAWHLLPVFRHAIEIREWRISDF